MHLNFRFVFSLLLFLGYAAVGQLQLSGIDLGKKRLQEPVSIAIARDTAQAQDTLSIALTLHMEKHIHIYSAESLFFKASIATHQGLGQPVVGLPHPNPFTNFDKSVVHVFVNGQKILIKCPILAPEWSLAGQVRSQACDSLMCFTPRTISFTANSTGALTAGPETSGAASPQIGASPAAPVDVENLLDKFSVVGSAGGFLNVAHFSDFLNDPAKKNAPANGFASKGLLVVILLILLGGIALNLTPCVLPMMPITIAIIGAGAQAKSHGRGMFVGAIYGLSMALTYGVLGLFVVLTGTQFGVINSSPIFNIAIAIIFIIMGLAMFDIIQVDFTRFRKSGVQSSERGKLLTVFVMGIVASLLAGACVAPVVISVVLYAGTLYANGNPIGLLLPFLLGIGMALPWPFAGAGLTFLPKPGKWMVWVKYCFGVFIFAMALYYGYLGVNLIREAASQAQQTSPKDKTAASELPWTYSLGEGLQKAQAEKKLVFIDFWASWCKNCEAMDATTFKNHEIKKLMAKYVLIKYQAEKPDDPAIRRILERFNVVGLPTYVVLLPK
jgi:thioredoxin:protein disulfide reductase